MRVRRAALLTCDGVDGAGFGRGAAVVFHVIRYVVDNHLGEVAFEGEYIGANLDTEFASETGGLVNVGLHRSWEGLRVLVSL